MTIIKAPPAPGSSAYTELTQLLAVVADAKATQQRIAELGKATAEYHAAKSEAAKAGKEFER